MTAVLPGVVVWVTGLPGSGKTTLAGRLVAGLRGEGRVALWLDGDDLRPHLNGHGYRDEDRARFYKSLGHLARLGVEAGAVAVVSATAHRRAWRDAARADALAAGGRFVEVWLTVDGATCAARDPKGLYRDAAAGLITGLPGVGAEYEAPHDAEVTVEAEEPLGLAVARVRARV